jgi:putative cardiolipin synthase
MHNQSLTADNQATIVGGRNIGNEYFGAGDATVFADLDVLVVGPVVRDVSNAFDLYWNSASAYPAAPLVGAPPADPRAWLASRFDATRASPASTAYLEAVRKTPLVAELLSGKLPLEWADARLVYDDPAKTLGKAERSALLITRLEQVIGKPKRELDLVSPYFVPAEAGTAAFTGLARQGVKVRVLTNSLAATDVAAVHAGYAKRRDDLLASGVELYELKRSAYADRARESGQKTLGGSSAASLHAKTFAVDRERIFVGSFNFDPRSAQLNTEMGLVIDSPALASGVSDGFDKLIPRFAYQVRQDAGGLTWIERTPEGEKRHAVEPETGAVERGAVGVMSVLPIEWLL